MILLEKLLAGLEVRVEGFARCLVPVDGRLELAACGAPTIHYNLRGAGIAQPSSGSAIALRRHTVMVVPAGSSMSVTHGAGTRAAPPEACRPLTEGAIDRDHEWGLVLACGQLSATYRKAGLFDRMTEPLIDDFACTDGVCKPFETLLQELAEPRPGTQALADVLMQQCLVLILRRYCASGECRLPWLAALEDSRLNRVVEAMLDHPERPFTLDGLAEIAGMSRSAFAAHFAEAFEQAPIEFLKELRLRQAADLLRTTDLPIKAIAGRVGYTSRSYFSRAFKACHGVEPAAFRSAAATLTPPLH